MTRGAVGAGRGAGVMLVALVLAGFVPGCGPTHKERQEKAQAHWGRVRGQIKVQLARQHFERDQVAESVRILEDALANDPESIDGHVLLARCQLELGQVAAAQRSIDRAGSLAQGKPGAELAYVQGQIAERRGEPAEALQAYEQARGLDDTRPVYLTSAAQCLVKMGRAQDALTLLQEKVVDYGNDPAILALCGEIALHVGDRDLAERSFRAALAAGDFNPAVAEEYALLAAEAGRYEEVLAVLAPLRVAGDGDLSPTATLAAVRAMLALGQVEPAREELSRLPDRNTDNLAAWYLLGQAGILADDLPAMVRSAAEARRLAPEAAQTLLLESYAMLKENRLTEAQAVLEKLRERQDNDPLVHCLLGWAARRRDDAAGARQHFRGALEVDPSCAWARTELARLEGRVPPAGEPL